jgi:hypothetical protein
MGITYVEGTVSGTTGKQATAKFLLDDVSEAYISLPLGDGHTPVVSGEDGDQALLGVVTLEELGLVFNPFQRSLQPARMMMA